MLVLAVIIGYLLLLVGLGLLSNRYFRGGPSDFFVASRSIGPFVFLMSIYGTTMTAFAMVGSTGEAFRIGVGTYGQIASSSALIHSACFFFIGLRLWAFGRRHGYVTQIEFFRDRFGSPALGYLLFPILVGLLIPYLLIGLMGAGSVVRGVTAGALPAVFPATDGAVPPALSCAVVAAVVLSYVFVSGVRGAAWANTFQTIVFIGAGLLVFFLIAAKLGGPSAASAMADPAKAVRVGRITELEFFSYSLIPLSAGMFPHLFQNCLTARSSKTFRLMLVGHPICIMLTWVPCILIGFWATGAVAPGTGERLIPEGANPNAVLGMMVGKLAMPFAAGVVAAGVLAAIMSSLDSQFVSLGTMFTRDLVIPLGGRGRFSDGQILWLARGFIVAIVAVTYLLTLIESRHIFTLGIWCFSGYAGLTPLVIGALYWKRATAAGALAAVAVAALVWLALFRASGFGADAGFVVWGMLPVVPITLACALTLVLVSLLTRPPSEETLSKFFATRS